MIRDIHIQPQSLSDLFNQSVKVGGRMYKIVSPLFYLFTVLYFISVHYVSGLLTGLGAELLLTLANLSFPFFVTAYFIKLMIRETEKSKRLTKWNYLKLLPVLTIASLFYWIIFVAGSMLFLIPGLIFFLYFIFFPTILSFEQKTLIQSFKRSAQLVRGSFFRVATLYAIFLGAQASLIVILNLIVPSGSFIILVLAAILLHILIVPFQATAFNLLYLELRAEREAFDFEVFEVKSRKHLIVKEI